MKDELTEAYDEDLVYCKQSIYIAVCCLDLLQLNAKICMTNYSLWLYSISIYSIFLHIRH